VGLVAQKGRAHKKEMMKKKKSGRGVFMESWQWINTTDEPSCSMVLSAGAAKPRVSRNSPTHPDEIFGPGGVQ
jgi:hypothetical protein